MNTHPLTRTILQQHKKSALDFPAAALCLALAAAMALVVLSLPREPGGLAVLADSRMAASGVEHPVTAVLLNFRSYDTWLELAVLLLGWLGVLAVRGSLSLENAPMNPDPSKVLLWFVRGIVPIALLVSGYLLWLGKFAAGGAFQAGVVAGAAGVLLWLAGYRSVAGMPGATLKLAVLAGVVGFALVAVATLAAGTEMLRYPAEHAGTIILAIEFLATVSIGTTVTALLIGLQPSPEALGTEKPG
jgi:multisubunit Na+/H+ antiporter MnhB subunit